MYYSSPQAPKNVIFSIFTISREKKNDFALKSERIWSFLLSEIQGNVKENHKIFLRAEAKKNLPKDLIQNPNPS